MIGTVLAAFLSYWKRQPFQLVTLILGLSLATALWSGVQAINAEARKSYSDAADVLGGGALAELKPETGAIAVETYAALRRAGWPVSPVIDGWLRGEQGRVRLVGIDPLTLPQESPMRDVAEGAEIEGFLGIEGVILAAPSTAARLRSLYGDRVKAVDGFSAGLALTDIATAASLLERSDFDRLIVAPGDHPGAPLADIAPDLRETAPATAEDLGRLTDSFHLNLTAFSLLSFAVGLFIVNGAIGLAFEQRRPVFRTMRALGVTARTLVVLLAAELLILAIVAGLFGVLLGYLIAALLLPDVAATLRGVYGASVEGTLSLSPLWWLSGLAIAVLGTAFASATGLLRVARLAPLAPAKPRAWAMASGRAMRHQLVLAGLCLTAAVAALVLGSGLASGFVLLGGLLLASALALRVILAGLVL
ncbi:MAG: ABC transporter permease, partial [Rhodobacteraceae bacterium]